MKMVSRDWQVFKWYHVTSMENDYPQNILGFSVVKSG